VVSTWEFVPVSPAGAKPLDGRIVYEAFRSGIYTIDPDGTHRTHLVKGDYVYTSRWLPDGSGVSFIHMVDANLRKTRIEAVDVNGTNRHGLIGAGALPGNNKEIYNYAWSPDGSQIALQMWGALYGSVFVANADGSSMTRLKVGQVYDPAWSSLDRIVATRNSGRLITFDPDGGNRVRVTGALGRAPAWSPDGTEIAFRCGNFRHMDVCTVNADGSGLVNLTNSPQVDWFSAWSPDGSRIVWSISKKPLSPSNLWRMKTDGSGKTRITATRRIDENNPDWTVLP
jgi:Tol biopolymer transport system component